MKNREVEKNIYEAFENRKPELFSKIMEQCPKMSDSTPKESFLARLKRSVSFKRITYSFASVSFIVIMALNLIGQTSVVEPEVYSVLAIDVNPSIVLELDVNDYVINVIANNEDAEIVIGDVNVIGEEYQIAVNSLIDSMVSKGYINETANSVLLSISSSDEAKEDAFMNDVSQLVNERLISKQINPSIIVQSLEFEEAALELASSLGISEAKAELLLDVIEQDPRIVVEELAVLSVNELNLLLESKNIVIPDVTKTGSASTEGIITEDEAYQITLIELDIIESDIVEVNIELTQGIGGLLYEVVISTDTDEYIVTISARSGEVLDQITNIGDVVLPNTALSEEVVKNLIVTELGLPLGLVTFISFDEKIENGVAYYAIEFEYDDEVYEIEIDAVTGIIYYNSMDTEGFNNNENSDRRRDNNG